MFPMSLAGLHLILQQRDRFNIRIVNVSVGSFSGRNMSETSALVRGVEEIWDAGLVVVVAAGNMGPKRGNHHHAGHQPQSHHGRLFR